MNVYTYVGDNPITHIDPLGLAETSLESEPGQSQNDPAVRATYTATTPSEKAEIKKFERKTPESTCSVVQNNGGGSGEDKAREAAEHESWANHWKEYPVTGPAVRAREEITAGRYGKAALDIGNAFIDGAGAGGLVRGGLRKTFLAEFNELFAAETKATFGQAVSSDYRATFFAGNPGLEGQVVVHHAVEQQILTRYPGVVSEAEIHSLENLRGIPKTINSEVHLTQIRREWNQFYRQNSSPTKGQMLQKATDIDKKYGSQFQPPR